MPVTFACMTICTFAISGIPLFSGFYSKDMILMQGFLNMSERFEGWSFFATLALALAACMTCFYMFRMLFITFFGEYRGDKKHHMYSEMLAKFGRGGHLVYHDHDDHHGDEHGGGHAHVPHESPLPIVVAISILALLGFFGGHFWPVQGDPMLHHSQPWFTVLNSPESMYGHEVGAWIAPHPESAAAEAHHEELRHVAHSRAVKTSTLVVVIGLLAAVFLYLMRRDLPAKITARLGLVYEAVCDKYYVDEVVNATFIAASFWASRALSWVDANVVDGFVNLVGRTGKFAGTFSAWIDRTFVDGAVNGVALVTQAFGSVVRLFQTGRIQQYATFAVAGGLMAAAWLILT
jgi:NADH-quinone oxidoreductase subunit L